MKLTGHQSFFELELLTHSQSDKPVVGVAFDIAIRSGWQRHRSIALGLQLPADEIQNLIDWLRQAGKPHVVQSRLLFSNASIAFDCLTADADECMLQVKLADKMAPAWHGNPLLPFWIPILTNRSAIQQAADELYTQYRSLVA